MRKSYINTTTPAQTYKKRHTDIKNTHKSKTKEPISPGWAELSVLKCSVDWTKGSEDMFVRGSVCVLLCFLNNCHCSVLVGEGVCVTKPPQSALPQRPTDFSLLSKPEASCDCACVPVCVFVRIRNSGKPTKYVRTLRGVSNRSFFPFCNPHYMCVCVTDWERVFSLQTWLQLCRLPSTRQRGKKACLSAYVNSVAFEFKILNYCYHETNTDGTPAAVMCSVTSKMNLGPSQRQ